MDANSSGASAGIGSGTQEDVATLKRELSTLHNALQLQSSNLAREQMRAASLATRLLKKDDSRDEKRTCGDKQTATLLRALLVLESTLRKERMAIAHKLRAKDLQIERQKEEIDRLKSDRRTHCANCQQVIGFTSEQTNIETDPEFHSLDSVDNHNFERSSSYRETQHQPFQKNSRLVKSFQLSKCDNTSSSEEVFEGSDVISVQCKNSFAKNKPAFVRKDVTRRSRKYSLRKQNSVNSESSLKKQSKSGQSSSSAEDGAFSEKDSKFRLGAGEDMSDAITKDIQRATNKIDALLSNAHQCHSLDSNIGTGRSISEQIDNLHGVRKVKRFAEAHFDTANDCGLSDRPWYTNVSDPEQDLECNSKIKLDKNRSMSTNDILSSSLKNGSESVNPTSTPDCKAGKEECNEESSTRTLDNEPNENWYASASEPDDERSCEIYKNNPVLECVNQILLQNSLDENSSESPRACESPSPKSLTKKVQFSTLNSISIDDNVRKTNIDIDCDNNVMQQLDRVPQRRSYNRIVKFSLETASEHSYEVPVTSEGFSYEIQSIYSNDYEPVMTQNHETKDVAGRPVPMPRSMNCINNSESGHNRMNSVKCIARNIESKLNGNNYVDMDSGTGAAGCKRKMPRVPPALPPKPKNLVSKSKLNASSSNSVSAQSSDPVGVNQRSSDVHNLTKSGGTPSAVRGCAALSEPDYCSISEINVPVVSSGMRALISTQATVEIHALSNRRKPSLSIAEKRSVPKTATVSRINPNKLLDRDIPKLPQVTEIIIPDDEDVSQTQPPKIPMETFPGKTAPHLGNKIDFRNSIQIGHSVSTILTDIKNRNASAEAVSCGGAETTKGVSKAGTKHPVAKEKSPCVRPPELFAVPLPLFQDMENDSEKFDLSQNFEEFKMDDCEFTAEEYRISSSEGGSVEECAPDEEAESTAHDELDADNNAEPVINYSKMTNKPDLLSNIENIETDSIRYSDLESSHSSSSNCGSYNTVKCEPPAYLNDAKVQEKNLPFEYFLESSGLCSKSILTPSRPPNSNHKSVLKPKDIKTKSKAPQTVGRATPVTLYDRLGTNTAIKYFEPYL